MSEHIQGDPRTVVCEKVELRQRLAKDDPLKALRFILTPGLAIVVINIMMQRLS